MNRKTLLQWLPLVILAIIMLTDLRPIVMGGIQRGLLATGLWKPALPIVATAATYPPTDQVASGGSVAYPHDIPLITLGGKNVNLSELKGKVVFVNLWASWCPPCVAEMPGIHALYQKVDKSKVAFVMISLDEKPERRGRCSGAGATPSPCISPPARWRRPLIPAQFPPGPKFPDRTGHNYNWRFPSARNRW